MRASVPSARARLCGLLGCLLCAVCGCAAPPSLLDRELATERYEIRDAESVVGSLELRLSTAPRWGWKLVETIRRGPPGSWERIELQLCPDWSPKAARMTRERAGARVEARYEVDLRSGDVTGQVQQTGSGAFRRVEGHRLPEGLLATDSIAPLLTWLRARPLEVGEKREGETLFLSWEDLELRPLPFVLERLPDRARRLAYRYRIGTGEWCELETDHRDLPLSWRCGDRSIELVTGSGDRSREKLPPAQASSKASTS
jgi:hypothetical protein